MSQAENAALAEKTSSIETGSQEFLTFELGAEEYGIDILEVQDISKLMSSLDMRLLVASAVARRNDMLTESPRRLAEPNGDLQS